MEIQTKIPTARMWRTYTLGWLAYLALLVIALGVLTDSHDQSGFRWDKLAALLWVVPQALILALLWPLSGWLERRQAGRVFSFLVHALCAPLYSLLSYGIPALLYGPTKPFSFYVWPGLYAIMMYAVIAGAFHMVRLSAAKQRQALAMQQAQALLVASELSALRSKLNPHFLFNTLHSIIALTRRDPGAAETALFQFSDMLRYVLDTERSGVDRVTLDAELDFVRDYLELEQLRLGQRLRVEWELDPDAGEHPLPALSLQPLVENSIKHAFNPHSRPGVLRIATRREERDGSLTVSVSDDGPGVDEDAIARSPGLGIRTIRRRLQLDYGGRASFLVRTAPGRGFAVTFTIPATVSAESYA
jgi:signal transduction histidine kinase